jgi:hypothetical protein
MVSRDVNLTPLTLIGGSASLKTPKTGSKIDWLAITVPYRATFTLYPSGLTVDAADCVPPRGYKAARKFTDGRIEAIHPDRPDMGRHIVYSGSCLNNLEKLHEMTGLDVLRYYMAHECKITRIDIAVDAHDSAFDILKARDTFKAGKAATNAKKSTFLSDENDGYTLYVGTRNSEAMLRIYDKAKESGITGDWIRFELECRESKAQQVADMLFRLNEPSHQMMQSMIKGFIDFPKDQIYQSIMKMPATIITRAKDTSSDTLKWLLEVAAPKLGEYAAMSSDPFLIDHFVTLAQERYDAIRDSMQATKFDDIERLID